MTKVVTSQDVSVPLFKNAFFDKFTRVHWAVPLILYLPLILFFLYQSFFAEGTVFMISVVGLSLGFLLWTLLEYLLHRFVFHFEAKSKLMNRIVYLFHGVHHAYPSDSWRLVMPPAVSIPLAFLFYFSFSRLVPSVWFPSCFSGFSIGYVAYDMIHYATHHCSMKNPAARYLKKYHLRHHFKDPHRGYGVSSPLWDFVFKTRFSKG